MNNLLKKYLFYFAQEHVEFRFAEIQSLLKLCKISMSFIEDPTPLQPFWLVEFGSEREAVTIANRSVSLRCCMELWESANDMNSLHDKLKRLPTSSFGSIQEPGKSFKIKVTSYGKHVGQRDKVAKLQTFGYLPFKGPVSLTNPDVSLQYLEYYGTDSNNPPPEPHRVFFGRQISEGARSLIKKLSLKTRKFIGNTSMDPQLSLLMANQALVQEGDLVLDPFVGSGSLLVSAAQFGGFVVGGDIDFLMLHAKNKPSRIRQKIREEGESVQANLSQYGLEGKYLDVLVNDFSIPVWKTNFEFDSIITDPPYGIRESTERIGIHKQNYTISEEHLSTHIPSKIEYGFPQIYQDLLHFSAKHLKMGGRLVCWFPVLRNDYSEVRLPHHPCLRLIANSEQTLTNYMSRRLLTYEKTDTPDSTEEITTDNSIGNFRHNYFRVRTETRNERRMKEARQKEQNRIEAEKRKAI